MSRDENEPEREEPTLNGITLEPPPAPAQTATNLFAEDPLALATAKAGVLESLLRLATRDVTFQDYVRDILLIIMNAVKSEAGSIFEVDSAKGEIFFLASVGRSSDTVTNFTIPIGQGIVGHVAESRQPLVVNELVENKMHLKAISEAVGFEARNMIALPLVIRGRIFGVLELLNRMGEEGYTSADVDLLKFMSEMASKIIEIRMLIMSSKAGASSVEEKKAA